MHQEHEYLVFKSRMFDLKVAPNRTFCFRHRRFTNVWCALAGSAHWKLPYTQLSECYGGSLAECAVCLLYRTGCTVHQPRAHRMYSILQPRAHRMYSIPTQNAADVQYAHPLRPVQVQFLSIVTSCE
jgi:hypothetical protein